MQAVSRTAIGVARIRAAESRRPDRLFDDPVAATFVAAAGIGTEAEGPASPQRRALAFHVVIRTRFFDDYLLGATRAGCAQVVLLAAGLDARAFRLDWPDGTRLFEVDLPALTGFKESVVADTVARCDRAVVPADLLGDWVPSLAAAGFRADRPTAWLAEGLLVYLDPAGAAHVLTSLTAASAPGSRLAFERSGGRSLDAADTRAATDLWQGGLGVAPEEWLTEHGWQPSVHRLGDVAARLGRPLPRESESGFVVAVR